MKFSPSVKVGLTGSRKISGSSWPVALAQFFLVSVLLAAGWGVPTKLRSIYLPPWASEELQGTTGQEVFADPRFLLIFSHMS